LLDPWESLQELKLMIKVLDVQNCVFRNNHASNYLPLKANLPSEKEALLATLEQRTSKNEESPLSSF